MIDAVAETTKSGYVFLFDRSDGTPLFPLEYRKYPLSTVPGELNGTLVLTETPMLGVSDLMITFMPDLSPEPDAAPTEAWDLGEEETVIDESCSDIS